MSWQGHLPPETLSWQGHLPPETLSWQGHLPPGTPFAPDDLLSQGTLVAAWTRQWAQAPGAVTIIGVAGNTLSAGALEESTRQVARRLLGAGLAPGDRLLVSAEASPELVIGLVGALRAGITVVPANTAYRQREISHIVGDARPAMALVDDAERGDWAADAATACGRHLTVIGPDVDLPVGSSEHEALVDAVSPSSPALIAYTSGTTGTPKGAILTHANLLANATSITRAWRWSPDDRLILALPLFHGHGLCVGLFGTLLAGASAVILPSFDPPTVCSGAGTYGATMFFGVPTMYHRLVSTPNLRAMGTLRLCVSGSAPLPASLFEEFAAATGQRPLERYGATEVLMAISNPHDGERRPGTVGFPLPGVEVDLVPAEGGSIPHGDVEGDVAEILVRSPMTFAGYHNLPGPTAEALSSGWFHTGDLATRSPDGYVTIKGRSKELIITGGLNVYPREVEEVISSHPEVAEVAVAGRPSDHWGEQVTAFVVTTGGTRERAELARSISDIAAAGLAPYKCPKEIVFVDSLPRNALGKVVRHLLIE